METQKKTENLLLIVLGVLVILALLLIALNNNSNLFSKYSSYEKCYINEMSKMPDGLDSRGTYSPQADLEMKLEIIANNFLSYKL